MKLCNGCNQVKVNELFYKNARCKSGLSSRCKECTREAASKWYMKNRGKDFTHQAASRQKRCYEPEKQAPMEAEAA